MTINATAQFLGDSSTWDTAILALQDIQSLFGGYKISMFGSGQINLIHVMRDSSTATKTFLIDTDTAIDLFRLCIEVDFLTIESLTRMGIPDEAFPTIILSNAKGDSYRIAKWENDKVAGFDDLYQRLLGLKDQI